MTANSTSVKKFRTRIVMVIPGTLTLQMRRELGDLDATMGAVREIAPSRPLRFGCFAAKVAAV